MCSYILMQINCGLFEGYSLFYQDSVSCAESIAVQMIHSVSTDKKQKITLEWEESGAICHAASQSASVRAKVFPVSETELLCETLAEAFRLDAYEPKGRCKYGLIYSLIKGPANIRRVNEMLMDRWVFADT
ncbi:MAG: hypothetical protein PHW77_06520 [Eubacteriales bacterium]|nr:hypothetical protein [Eubacteriales bacterium]